jgi:PleD family two-component response regulator
MTASFGVAELVYNQANSMTQLLKLADDALYQAKARGKNQVVKALPVKKSGPLKLKSTCN